MASSYLCRSISMLRAMKISPIINNGIVMQPAIKNVQTSFTVFKKLLSTDVTNDKIKTTPAESKVGEQIDMQSMVENLDTIKKKADINQNEVKKDAEDEELIDGGLDEKTRANNKKETISKLENHPFNIAKAQPFDNYKAWQPTVETHSSLMIEGVPYDKLHIITIKSSKNNTIMSLNDHKGLPLKITSAGICGFKNSKKSTAVAGQAAGLALSEYAKRRGIKNVRVVVKGMGNGRMASIKALQMGQMNIISITDRTPIPLPFARPPRPPVKRRI